MKAYWIYLGVYNEKYNIHVYKCSNCGVHVLGHVNYIKELTICKMCKCEMETVGKDD